MEAVTAKVDSRVFCHINSLGDKISNTAAPIQPNPFWFWEKSNYMYRIINDNCPSNFMSRFTYVSGGSRNSESCNLYINRSGSNKNFYYLGAKCWNIIPPNLRDLSDVSSFSNAYKAKLLSSAITDPNYMTNNSYDYFYNAA